MSTPSAGYHTVTPYITVPDSAAAIAFYQAAFGAEEVMRLVAPGGAVVHAEIAIGGCRVMLSDENKQWGNLSPKTLGGSAGSISLMVADPDAVFSRAVAAGAEVLMPVTEHFYGHRSGNVRDPFGHKWSIGTVVREMTPAEMQTAFDQWLKSMPQG